MAAKKTTKKFPEGFLTKKKKEARDGFTTRETTFKNDEAIKTNAEINRLVAENNLAEAEKALRKLGYILLCEPSIPIAKEKKSEVLPENMTNYEHLMRKIINTGKMWISSPVLNLRRIQLMISFLDKFIPKDMISDKGISDEDKKYKIVLTENEKKVE